MGSAINEIKKEAYAERYAEGVFKILYKLVEDGLISIETATECANVSGDGFLDAVESLND